MEAPLLNIAKKLPFRGVIVESKQRKLNIYRLIQSAISKNVEYSFGGGAVN